MFHMNRATQCEDAMLPRNRRGTNVIALSRFPQHQTFIALLRSEPRNMPTSLLPQALERLLELGMATEPSEWRSRVHALNVLRLVRHPLVARSTPALRCDPFLPSPPGMDEDSSYLSGFY